MFDRAKNIFLLGIKGVAMTNLAVILKKMGKNVTGCDLAEEFITDDLLRQNNIDFRIGFKTETLPKNLDLIVYSAAHGGINNPLILEAEKRGVKIISQAELIAQLMKQFKTTVAVTGCHGKTTTSSLLSYALIQLGVKPSYLVGAPSFNGYPGGDYASQDYFVIEADEYGVNPPQDLRPKFHFLDPDYIICTNIDFDHPDVYKDLEETKKAFFKFFTGKKLVVCSDDPSLRNLHQSFGFSKGADFVITNIKTNNSGTMFNLNGDKFSISLFGDKNVSNAAAVIVMLKNLGFSSEAIKKSIEKFTGAKRRFEKVFSNQNFDLYDDYGHHPTEIGATINAARKHFNGRRIILIFQPHTFSRTQTLLEDFVKALAMADLAFVLPIFASARENASDFSVSSQTIEKKAQKLGLKNVVSVSSVNKLVSLLKNHIQPGDVIFTLGAGDVYKLKNDIINVINERSKST